MQLVFLIQALRGGGAERILQTLAEYFREQGHQVTVFTLEAPDQAYELDPKILVRPFFTSRLCRGPGRLLLLPMQVVELATRLCFMRWDTLCSFMFRANFVAILTGLLGFRRPLVITEHVPPTSFYSWGSLKGRVMLSMTRALYPLAQRIQVVSESIKDSLTSLGVPPHLVVVIPNAVNVEKTRCLARDEHGLHQWIQTRPTIVNVGSLAILKGQANLIRAVSLVRKEVDVQLLIVGKGPEETSLRLLISELGLQNDVRLALWQKNPFAICKSCQVFAFSSLFEGFGLAIVEAMCCGLPIVTTSCWNGREDILQDGISGLVVPVDDPKMLAASLLRVLKDEALAKQLSLGAEERARIYDIEKIGPVFLDFLTRPL